MLSLNKAEEIAEKEELAEKSEIKRERSSSIGSINSAVKPPLHQNSTSIDDDSALKESLRKKLSTSDITPSWATASPPPPPPTNSVVADIFPSVPFSIAEHNVEADGLKASHMRRRSTMSVADTQLKGANVQFHGTHGSNLSTIDHEKHLITAADKEAAAYMSKALDESRRETNAVKLELEASEERFETCRSAYELLVETIKKEGSMLKQKDREKRLSTFAYVRPDTTNKRGS